MQILRRKTWLWGDGEHLPLAPQATRKTYLQEESTSTDSRKMRHLLVKKMGLSQIEKMGHSHENQIWGWMSAREAARAPGQEEARETPNLTYRRCRTSLIAMSRRLIAWLAFSMWKRSSNGLLTSRLKWRCGKQGIVSESVRKSNLRGMLND